MGNSNRLRHIPSVTEILAQLDATDWACGYSRDQLVHGIREELSDIRTTLQSGSDDMPGGEELLGRIRSRLTNYYRPSLTRVINATGIIVHTNLGRAPLAQEAVDHLGAIALGYSNLEFDLSTGKRGSRDKHLEKALTRLLGVEASLIVNNNAAALLLILNTVAEGKEVLVSRGELIEIGGSFRLPEIMKRSGAILREVGSTNKTRIQDYRDAINPQTAMILVAHPSNYQIVGFTEKPSLAEVVQLAREAGVMIVEDHGSGILLNLEPFGIGDEPRVQDRLEQGPDLVCFSGDKILGGPQAGIICGNKEAIKALKMNPLFRALRVDKMIYAALEATLLLYLGGQLTKIPVISMLSQTVEDLERRGRSWLGALQAQIPAVSFKLQPTTTYVGGGVAPMKGLSSIALSIQQEKLTTTQLAQRLREHNPPVIARIEENRLLFEIRTLTDEDIPAITQALKVILS